jgi:hypothetical protein
MEARTVRAKAEAALPTARWRRRPIKGCSTKIFDKLFPAQNSKIQQPFVKKSISFNYLVNIYVVKRKKNSS